MSKVISDTPTYLSSIIFGSGDLIELSFGWDYVKDWFEVFPIVHLFGKKGERLDLVSTKKLTSQGIKFIECKGSNYTLELNMKKLPKYVDSIYLSLGSEDSSKTLDRIKDLYVEISQSKSKEFWGQKEFESNTNSLVLLAFEKKDSSFSKSLLSKWDFNFLSKPVDSDFLRICSILSKENLFTRPEVVPTLMDKVSTKISSIISRLFK